MNESSEPFFSRRGAIALFCLACLATLIAVFYAEENWRGKRAWEKCRRELEAKGARLDWSAYIPPPVPNEQNVFDVPEMSQWFVNPPGGWATPASRRLTPVPASSWPWAKTNARSEILVDLFFARNGDTVNGNPGDAVLSPNDPSFTQQALRVCKRALGQRTIGLVGDLFFVGPSLEPDRPFRLRIPADSSPALEEVQRLISPTLKLGLVGFGKFHVEAHGSNCFRICLDGQPVAAAEYLAWNDQFEPEFKIIRKALERPRARMYGSYEDPYSTPLPNFSTFRITVQALLHRAQCHLLLGKPEAALRELTLVHDLCRLLETKPTTLVSAMIEVAVTGLYANTVADGLRLRAWRKPQLAIIERQLEEVDLLPQVREAFEAVQAGLCHRIETTEPGRLGQLFSLGASKPKFSDYLNDPKPLIIGLVPRGWASQNLAVVTPVYQRLLEQIDATHQLILTRETISLFQEVNSAMSKRFSPFTFLMSRTVPNFLRVSQTLGFNQTLANEALVACALERYRLAHGEYPETLVALVPQFLVKLPHDLIGGQLLKYHRTSDGQFVLYSVGWNGTDDGGVPGKGVPEGDWVWQ